MIEKCQSPCQLIVQFPQHLIRKWKTNSIPEVSYDMISGFVFEDELKYQYFFLISIPLSHGHICQGEIMHIDCSLKDINQSKACFKKQNLMLLYFLLNI